MQVISGQQLPKVDKTKEGCIVDPLVRVEVFGIRPDTTRQETSYVENNGETWAVLEGGGRGVPLTFLPSCPPSNSAQASTLPLCPWEAVWNRRESGLEHLGSESWPLTYQLR